MRIVNLRHLSIVSLTDTNVCSNRPNGFIVSNEYGENKLNYMRRIYSQFMYKVKTKNKCGYKLFSVFITTVDRSHNK